MNCSVKIRCNIFVFVNRIIPSLIENNLQRTIIFLLFCFVFFFTPSPSISLTPKKDVQSMKFCYCIQCNWKWTRNGTIAIHIGIWKKINESEWISEENISTDVLFSARFASFTASCFLLLLFFVVFIWLYSLFLFCCTISCPLNGILLFSFLVKMYVQKLECDWKKRNYHQ